MIHEIIEYMINSKIELIFGLFFCLLGVLLGVLLSKREVGTSINESMTYREIVVIIKETYVLENSEKPKKEKKSSSKTSSSDNDELGAFIVGGIILTSLYSKYHIQIMTSILVFTLVSLLFLFSLTINLNKRNSLDKYNKNWILMCFLITLFNLISIFIIDAQDVTLINIEDYTKVLYYLLGAFFLVLTNLCMVIILTNIWSTNSFIKKPNKLNTFFVKRLIHISEKHRQFGLLAFGLSIFSGLLSSGIFHNLINK